jgi:hypothetical protein
VLFPVRLDDAVFATTKAWALKLRDNRNIGDFRAWKDHPTSAPSSGRYATFGLIPRLLRQVPSDKPDYHVLA